MFKRVNYNKDFVQTIINKKENEYILKHQYCTDLYYLLQNERKDIPIQSIGKIIGMIYENDFTFVESCFTDKHYFFTIVNEALQLLSTSSTTEEVEKNKNPLLTLKKEKFNYCLQLYNKLQQMHPSMPNLIVCKIIGMIYENRLDFICLLVQNELDFLIIVKEALEILMKSDNDKEAISFYKNNKYDIQNSYNIIISNFIDNELDKKNYLLDCIHFKFTSYYKFAIENSNDKNTKKLMFSDSTKISESIVFNMLDILKTLEVKELEKIIFNINHFKCKCKEAMNQLRNNVNHTPDNYPSINLMKINTIVNAYFL